MCMLIRKHAGRARRIEAESYIGKVCCVYFTYCYSKGQVNAHSEGFPEAIAKSYSKYKVRIIIYNSRESGLEKVSVSCVK